MDYLLLLIAVASFALICFMLGYQSPSRPQSDLIRRVRRDWPNESRAYERGVADGYQQGVEQAHMYEEDQ